MVDRNSNPVTECIGITFPAPAMFPHSPVTDCIWNTALRHPSHQFLVAIFPWMSGQRYIGVYRPVPHAVIHKEQGFSSLSYAFVAFQVILGHFEINNFDSLDFSDVPL